jgi:hypothetical protein
MAETFDKTETRQPSAPRFQPPPAGPIETTGSGTPEALSLLPSSGSTRQWWWEELWEESREVFKELEQLAKVYGFTSVEEYVLNVVNVQLRKIQEREEEESREAEKRRKFIATDKLFVRPNIPRLSIEPGIRRNESNFIDRSGENKSKLEEGDPHRLVEQHPSGSPAEL